MRGIMACCEKSVKTSMIRTHAAAGRISAMIDFSSATAAIKKSTAAITPELVQPGDREADEQAGLVSGEHGKSATGNHGDEINDRTDPGAEREELNEAKRVFHFQVPCRCRSFEKKRNPSANPAAKTTSSTPMASIRSLRVIKNESYPVC